MNPELFPVEPSKAPMSLEDILAADVLRHRRKILTHHDPGSTPPWIALEPVDVFGDAPTDDIGAIMARHCRLYDEGNLIGYGKTEAEAVVHLARNRGWLVGWKEVA